MKNYQVLYFSFDVLRINDFYSKAKDYQNEFSFQLCDDIFTLIDEKLRTHRTAEPQLCMQDLPVLLRKKTSYNNLFVILDYVSFYARENGRRQYIRYKQKKDCKSDTSLLRKTILLYPEINFLFDQSEILTHNRLMDFAAYLFDEKQSETIRAFHVFDWKTPFVQLSLDYSNLFDGSKLRLEIKKHEIIGLGMNDNYGRIHDSRQKNCAISVEEESSQNRFISYVLFTCGFQVFQVNTARMLLMLNNGLDVINKPAIVIRDADIQFPDARDGQDYNDDMVFVSFLNVPIITESGFEFRNIQIIKSGESVIDYIRDYKINKEDKSWNSEFPKQCNPFWNHLIKGSCVFFVTNGLENLLFCNKGRNHYFEKSNSTEEMAITGLHKPISGLYNPFLSNVIDSNGVRTMEKVFNGTRYVENQDGYIIDKHRRKMGSHGVPPDIYDLVDEMLSRAIDYYNSSHFIKSAVIAQESMEILNGFHPQLMIKAYHLKSISENAIAMDVLGLNEKMIVEDSVKRIEIIREDVHRIVSSLDKDEDNPQKKQEIRILKNIFSNCRDRCHQLEYYSVESVFISAMAHLEEHDPNGFIIQAFSHINKKVSNLMKSLKK